MATTAATAVEHHSVYYLINYVDLTTIVPGETVTVTHGGPAYSNPFMVTFETQVSATNGSPVTGIERIVASDSSTNGTVAIKVKTETGGDLTGATVRVFFWFTAQQDGGGVTLNTPL